MPAFVSSNDQIPTLWTMCSQPCLLLSSHNSVKINNTKVRPSVTTKTQTITADHTDNGF
jgi:hypothetical protein